MLIRIEKNNNKTQEELPLIHAYFAENINLFEKLIKEGENVNCLSIEGDSLISIVVGNPTIMDKSKNKKFFDLLLSNDVHLGCIGGELSPFKISIGYRHDPYFMEKIIERQYDVNCGGGRVNEQDMLKDRPIFTCILKRDIEKTNSILCLNPHLQALNTDGETILNYLIKTKNYSYIKAVIQSFIANGANPNQKNIEGEDSFHTAATFLQDEDLIDILINKKTNLEQTDSNGFTPLMCSIISNNPCCTKILIKKGSLVNTQNIEGKTALMLSVVTKSNDIFDHLLKSNADFHIQDNDGNNVAHYIVNLDQPSNVFEFSSFIKKQKDLFLIKNNKGDTALSIFQKNHPSAFSAFEKIINDIELEKKI